MLISVLVGSQRCIVPCKRYDFLFSDAVLINVFYRVKGQLRQENYLTLKMKLILLRSHFLTVHVHFCNFYALFSLDIHTIQYCTINTVRAVQYCIVQYVCNIYSLLERPNNIILCDFYVNKIGYGGGGARRPGLRNITVMSGTSRGLYLPACDERPVAEGRPPTPG